MRSVATAMAVAGVFLAAAASAPAAGRCGSAPGRPWCDTSLSPDQRAGLLLGALTQDEKISLLAGDDPFGVGGGEHSHTGTSDGVPRVGLPTVYYSDGPVGPRQGKTTAMPIPMALAATFDPAAAHDHGRDDRERGPVQGQRRHLRPDREHHADAPRRPDLRGLRRGSVPRLAADRRVDPRRAVPGPDRERQALRGQQPGGRQPGRRREPPRAAAGAALLVRQPHDRRCGSRRAHAARGLPAAVRGGRQGGERRLGDVLVQPAERSVRLPERAPAQRGPQARLGLQGLRARGLRRRAPGGNGGVAEQRPRLRALAGHRLFAHADPAGAPRAAGEHGRRRRARAAHTADALRLRLLRPAGLQGRRRPDRQARARADGPANRGVGNHPAPEPRCRCH